jgi:endoglucanase
MSLFIMKRQYRYCIYFSLPLLLLHHSFAQPSNDIRLNQIGFYPSMPKIAVVNNASSTPFYVISVTSADTAFRGILSEERVWPYSDESVRRADFSELRVPGRYMVSIPGIGSSPSFDISQHVHRDLAIGAIRSYYYQRASIPLFPAYAGEWARSAGHPDTSVLIHQSAASIERPANSTISAPGGWYDAGDYNKYIVNSGISTYTLLATYEHFPEICERLSLNIPESENGIPDIIDEALWNVRWMLTMQDPNDGGVYCKLTNPSFDGFIMPAEATAPRYVVVKTTAAALDFAAVMAQTARITAHFRSALPGFSDSCLTAALRAWEWAEQHPSVQYDQNQLNADFSPPIKTGTYADTNVLDEFAWAGAELYVTTTQNRFLSAIEPILTSEASVPGWRNVRTLGLYTLARYHEKIGGLIDTNEVRSRLITLANSLCASKRASAYDVVMGVHTSDFNWGGTGVAANQGMALLVAFELTHDSTYLHAALSNLDYLLGRNGTAYCFVTGFGSHSPLHIHHRISQADNIPAPVPGLLVGGPNPDRQDRHLVTYASPLPALAYADEVESYASNEICINWNAPLVYLAVGLEALISVKGEYSK